MADATASVTSFLTPPREVHHGSCLCEAVRYTVHGAPSLQYLCHCRNCQKASGGAFNANCFFPRANFDVVNGKDNLAVYHFGGTGSGTTQHRHSCRVCCSPIFILPDSKPEIVVIFAGTLDRFDDFVPMQECWVKQRRSWLRDVEGAETFPKSRPITSGRPSADQ